MIRLVTLDYMTLLICLKYKLWGANSSMIDKWSIGDKIIFKIGDSLVAIAEVEGESFLDTEPLWPNGLFWNRIPIGFVKVLKLPNSIDFNGEIKDLFVEKWGKQYGWVILNKHPLPEEIYYPIFNRFDCKPDEISFYSDIDQHIANEKI